MADDPAREQRRQQALLEALGPGRDDAVDVAFDRLFPGLTPSGRARGLAAYRANAAATAARALAAAYPTVAQMLGADALAALARALWAAHPPVRGDLAEWGDALAGFIDADPLDGAPWLADVARLDWAVHRAERAADDPPAFDPAGLAPLADTDPSDLGLSWRAGTAVVMSPWPIVTLRAAHQGDTSDRLAPARAALAAGRAEAALVWRHGWRAEVAVVDAAEAAFTADLLAGATLGAALHRAGAELAFESWLASQMQRGLLCGAMRLPAAA